MSRLSLPILRTKLHRPPLTQDFVLRRTLLERLGAGVALPLTLVSAPAGYGKTTLVSHWLETSERPSAWVSLDDGDDSLVDFLNYFVAGVRTLFPGSCEHLSSTLNHPEVLPPLKHLVALLCNDLDEIEQPFVLVLDDYHLLVDANVHELINQLLKHPPRCLHLVLVCRHDPPLSLVVLRARNRMIEVRMHDLQFTHEESAQFLGEAFDIEDEALSNLQRSTEGWPAALRLAALALRHGSRRILGREELGNSQEFQEYLVTEVLANQEPEMRDWLCRTSILDRFCAPLCEAVCDFTKAVEAPRKKLGGSKFLHALQEQGLFSVPLDERREWFRYHHLFQESLRRRLTQECSEDLVATLHRHAADWLEGEGLIEEALQHLRTIGDETGIGRLIIRQRQRIAEEEHWHRLERWLAMAPRDLLKKNLEILLLKIWSADYHERTEEVRRLVDEAEKMIERLPDGNLKKGCFRGEIAALLARRSYVLGEAASVREYAQEALRLLPSERSSERGFAEMLLAAALQREGRGREAYALLHEALGKNTSQSAAYRGRLLACLCGIQWVDGDLPGILQTGRLLIEHAEKHRLYEALCFGKLFLAAALYQQNSLDEAERQTKAEMVGGRLKFVASLVWLQTLIDQAYARPGSAVETFETFSRRLLESGHTVIIPFLQAYRAELALRQGRSAEALQWARSYDALELPKGLEIHWMETTAVKAFLQQGSAESLAEAEKILDSLRRSFESIHYRRFLMDVEILQALLHDRRGEPEKALAALECAIRLAQPGRWIRVFVDLGSDVFKLLHRLEAEGDTLRYIGEIQAAFHGEHQGELQDAIPVVQSLIDPLTPRELEVLICLGERRTNKEIAVALGISLGTVKRHANNIYEKLGAHGRRKAVEKAVALGIMPSSEKMIHQG